MKTENILATLIIMLAMVSVSSASSIYMVDEYTYIAPGDTGNVDVKMYADEDVYGWQTNITFDPTCVNITDVDFNGTVVSEISAWHHYDNYITIACASNTGYVSGILANLSVESLSDCTSELQFTGEENVDRLICNVTADAIPADWDSGYITSTQDTTTDVYLSQLNLSSGSDVLHVMVNTSGYVNALHTYIEYDSTCVTISDVEINDPDWWMPTQPEYSTGMVYFSPMRWGSGTGDFVVVNMTVTCIGDESCESDLNFSDNGNPTSQGINGCNLGNISWTNGVANCESGSSYDISCYNCTDCQNKMNNASSGDVVTLVADIECGNDNCMMFHNIAGVIFDGNGHTMSGSYSSTGINIDNTCSNLTIYNITIEDFRHGLYIFGSDHNTVKNCDVSYNIGDGISIMYGSDNTIMDCTLMENRYYDLNFVAAAIDDCDNTIINVTGSGNRPIAVYNSTEVHLQDEVLSALILANASMSTLDNITVIGSSEYDNNGIRVYYSDNVEMTDVISSDNSWGIHMAWSDYCTLTNVVCNRNGQTGIHPSNCKYTTIDNSETDYNSQCGIYMSHSQYATIKDGHSSYNYFTGIYLDTGGYNNVSGMHIIQNHDPGILTGGSSDNLIYNNYFEGNGYYGNDPDYYQVSVRDDHSNTFNVTKRAGPNIIGGEFIGGNYWDGLDPVDADHDGIGDDPYMINGVSDANIDYLPLTYLAESDICGDVDCNGYVSANDVIRTYRKSLDPDYPLVSDWAADVDDNGYVSANDVIQIYRKSLDPSYALNCSA